jgi:hypothetical protein
VTTVGPTISVSGGVLNLNSAIATQPTTLNVSNGTLSVSTGQTFNVATVNLSGGALGGSDTLNVSGLFSFTGGTHAGSGATNANGGINVSANNNSYLDGRTLNNPATMNILGNGAWRFLNNAVVNNLATGTIDVQGDADLVHFSGVRATINKRRLAQEVRRRRRNVDRLELP